MGELTDVGSMVCIQVELDVERVNARSVKYVRW